MIYWIDDEPQILELATLFLPNLNIHTCLSWKDLPSVKEGDIIIHDWQGIGPKPKEIKGVYYLCCSSDISIDRNFDKPTNYEHVAEAILNIRRNESFKNKKFFIKGNNFRHLDNP